jgi:heptosyltransferase-2
VLSCLDGFVTNDSGPMHLAAALGVRLVAVFGSTDWRETAPFAERATVVREPVECAPCMLRECPIDHRCMRAVTVERVTEATLELFH